MSVDSLGSAVRFRGKFLFWGARLDAAAVQERRMERAVRSGVNFAAMLVALVLVLQFAWFVLPQPLLVFRAVFWTQQYHGQTVLFLFGICLAAYVAYRLAEESRVRTDIPAPHFGEVTEDTFTETDVDAFAKAPAKDRIDAARAYAPEAIKAVEDAVLLAAKFGHGRVAPAHLLGGLLGAPSIGLLLARLGIAGNAMTEGVQRMLAAETGSQGGAVSLAPEVVQSVFGAYQEAAVAKQRRVRPTEVLLALLRQKGPWQDLFFDLGADVTKVENVVAWIRVVTELREKWHAGRGRARFRPKGAMNRAMTALATPLLDRMSDDLTELGRLGYLPPFVERARLMDQVFRSIEGGRRHVLLVGAHGTGKEALMFGIAQRMVEEDVPKTLSDKRLIMLSVAKLVSGATPSEVAERIDEVLTEVARAGNIVLAIPNVHGLVGLTTGSRGGMDVGDALAEGLRRANVFAIATTTPEDDVAVLERSLLGQAFERVQVTEPEMNEAIRIVEAKAGGMERTNHVYLSYGAIETAVQLSTRYLHDRYLPEKAIEVLKEVCHAVASQRGAKAVVGSEDVAAVIAEKSKVPVTAVTQDEGDKLLRFEDVLHERMVGQDEAVAAVSRAIRRARAELRNEKRPIANFLFLGPTGVGKTELAKTVAEAYFGAEERMTRLDMSEYQDQQSLYRLVGVPGGGSQALGLLTEAVRRQPFTLLLLDELEKAHPDIINVFLQVMDDGRLTDAVGKTVDFTNVILIATTNAATPFITESLAAGQSVEQVHDLLMREKLQGIFRPEFLNRFDGVVVFRPLNSAEINEVARRMLIGVAKQLGAKGITLQVTEAAVAELAAAGFDPMFGARPLRRVIQERVQDALAQYLLGNQIGRRDVVVFDVGGRISIQKAEQV